MTYEHLKKGTMAFYRHVEELEKKNNALKKQLEISRRDNFVLRRLLNDQVETRGFTVIEGGMSEQSIKTMLTDNSA